MNDDNKDAQDEYDRKLKHWEALDRSGGEESRAYDRSVLTLSSAAIGASLIFLKDFAGASPQSTWVLVVSWVTLGFTIALTLLSMRLSVLAHDKKMEELKVGSESPAKQDAKVDDWVDYANWLSYAFFLVGVALLCLFAFLNMEKHDAGVGGNMYRHGSAEQ